MEAPKKGKKYLGKVLLALSNIVLVLIAVLFTILYSRNVKSSQEQLMRESFCATLDTMRQISERYLSDELTAAKDWAAYIEQEHMSMDEALDYIRAISNPAECEAHFVDMDTFDAWSTNDSTGINTIRVYRNYYRDSNTYVDDYILRMQKMYAGEAHVLGKYTVWESQRSVISTGCAVMLRQPDGSDRGYLLLRVVPIDAMKQLWLFPVNYPSAEIGLIDDRGWYVIPSRSMRSENFTEFVRYYNFPDDYYGADRTLAQLKEQPSGMLELLDSKGQDCYWYYSRLEGFEDLDILGYIPKSELAADATNISSIVFAVAGVLLLIVLIDGAYILNINRRLRATAAVAEKANDAKTQFLSSMSHDIRTPLNAVLGMTALAQSHANDRDYVQECLRKISLSGNHLLTLINDILEISRVESGRISLNPVPFAVQDLVSGLESITRSQAVSHGLELHVQYDALPESYLLGDKLRLTQVYLNLLNNAVKYTNPGGSIRLEVSEAVTDESVDLICVVADNGIGMSPEFQKTMYESFTRVSDSRIDKIQGTGLGLAIVKRIVDMMGGTIECVSAEHVGTTFTVRIPLLAAPAPAAASSAEAAPELCSDLHGVRVLIAEDNDLNWEIISEMLSSYDLRCERAENGQQCVDMLTAAPPGQYDLVLMDVQMPILDGRAATRQLRASARRDLHTIPIIAMTADAFAEDVQMCLDAGMDAHVAKPIEIEKVLAAIRLLLSRRGNDDGRPC